VGLAGPPPRTAELYVIGGGEDTAQYFAATWLSRHPRLREALADRAVTLAVCAGLQLFGHHMTDQTGHDHPGLGLLDLSTRPGQSRAVGETVAHARLPGVGLLTGFANHAGATTLGPGAWALGHVESGPGNNPHHRIEGALNTDPATHPAIRVTGPTPGVVGTYLHGPVLARNPALADHLLARVLGYPLPELDPGRLPDLPTVRATYLPQHHC